MSCGLIVFPFSLSLNIVHSMPFLNIGQNISQTISCLLLTQLPDPVVDIGSDKVTCCRMHCSIGCRSKIRLSQGYDLMLCLQNKAVQIFSSTLKCFGVLSLGPYAGLHNYGNFRPNPGSGYQMSGIAKLITRLPEIGFNCLAEQA